MKTTLALHVPVRGKRASASGADGSPALVGEQESHKLNLRLCHWEAKVRTEYGVEFASGVKDSWVLVFASDEKGPWVELESASGVTDSPIGTARQVFLHLIWMHHRYTALLQHVCMGLPQVTVNVERSE